MNAAKTNHISLSFDAISENEAFARMTAAMFMAQLNPTLDDVDVCTDVVLVNVNADDVAVVLQSSLNSGGVDAAAAGKHDLSAVGVPALHTGGDVGIAVELAAVEVVDVDVLAQLLSSSVSALHEAVAEALHRRNLHAAEEAQLGLAVLGDRVTGQVTCLLFLEGDAVAVCGDGIGADIALGHVNSDELDIRVLISSPSQRSTVQVADADDHISAVVDSLTDHGLAVLIGSQPYGFCLLGFFFQLGYEFLFIRRYLVMRFEVFVYVNTEFFFLQITYMAVAGKDFEIFSKEFLDGFCFRRRLDYDKVFLHKFLFFSDSRH